MRFGIFQNGGRNVDPATKLDLDLHEIVAADKAGFEEAWISEHNVGTSVVELLIAKAAGLTEHIRMGPAVRRIALYDQPQLIAIEGAMCDQLTRGRYQFAFGVTPAHAKLQSWGVDIADSEGRTLESIEFIRKIWKEVEPFDFEGKYFKGSGIDLHPKPYRPIPITIATTRPRFLQMAAQEGFRVITIWSASTDGLKQLGETFDAACMKYTGATRRQDLTVSRVVYVAETDEQAHLDVEEGLRTHFDRIKAFAEQGVKSRGVSENAVNAAFGISTGPGGGRSGTGYEDLVADGNVIIGSPETVIAKVSKTYREMGGFGGFMLVGGNDMGTPEQRERMYRLFADAVAPELDKLSAGLGA
jgi:alkanesulfonate monooxygenase SsuD/methylene tetrahydromethanopterin reductase-like flavin-dependent oxidoreductase (luciferase family)